MRNRDKSSLMRSRAGHHPSENFRCSFRVIVGRASVRNRRYARYLRQPLARVRTCAHTHTRSGTFPSLVHLLDAPTLCFRRVIFCENRVFPPPPAPQSFLEADDFTLHDDARVAGGRNARARAREQDAQAQTRPNVISISCSRTRARSHISDTVGQAHRPVVVHVVPRRRVVCTRARSRDAFFMATTWRREGSGNDGAPCGLWIIHR